MPDVAVLVQIGHGGLQGWLQSGPVVLKEPQHQPPHQPGEQREWVPPGLGNVALLHAQAAQGKQDAREQVHVDLQGGNDRGLREGAAAGNLRPTPMAWGTYCTGDQGLSFFLSFQVYLFILVIFTPHGGSNL